MGSTFRIGELASQLNVSADTLRYYEKQGLLSSSHRSAGGFRLFNQGDKCRVQFILRAKAVGFSLSEIKSLLAIQLNKSKKSCRDVKEITASKISDIELRIVELERFLAALKKLHQACCGGPKSANHCSILQTLDDPSKSITD